MTEPHYDHAVVDLGEFPDRLLLSAPELERLLGRLEYLLTVLVAHLTKKSDDV